MTAPRRRGRLVVLTGIDGSGKSTQARLLVAELNQRGIAADYVWARWEPKLLKPFVKLARAGTHSAAGGTEAAAVREEEAHRRLSHFKRVVMACSVVRTTWLLLAVLDYAIQIHQRVRRRLRAGVDVLVTDRYLPDFVADQALNMRYSSEDIARFMGSRLLRLFPAADLAFLIAIPPEVGYRRKSDGTPLTYLTERALVYEQIAKFAKMLVVDGTADKEHVANIISRQVGELLS